MKRRVVSRGLALLVGLLLVLVGDAASAAGQLVTIFDANGKIVSGPTGSTLFNVENGTWHGATGAGNAARVTIDRNIAFSAEGGAAVAGRGAATIATEFTALELASAGLAIASRAVPYIAVGLALKSALDASYVGWDDGLRSFINFPDPIPAGTQTQIKNFEYCGTPPGGACGPAVNYHSYDAQTACLGQAQHDYGVQFRGSVPGPGGNLATYCVTTLQAPTQPNQQPTPAYTVNGPGLTWTWETQTTQTKSCPNGVEFNDTTKCKKAITADQAGQLLSQKIDSTNGPAIGQEITAGNGVQLVPDTGITNSPNAIHYDGAAWPQVSGPASFTFGPSSSTSTSTTAVTNPDGTQGTATTTTTTTNTTNVTNVYNSSTVTSNIVNTTQTRTCDAAGVCTNQTTNQQPGDTSSQGDDSKLKVCGLPGGPACKIDETGTETAMKPGLDAGKVASDSFDTQTSKYTAVAGGGGAAGIGIAGLSDFKAPDTHGGPGILDNLVQDGGSCTPMTTSLFNASLAIDPCPVVNFLKPVLDWLCAALTALALWAIWIRSPTSSAEG